MRNKAILGLTAMVLGLWIGDAPAAQIDFGLQAGTTQANGAGSVLPPAATGLNQKGFAALKQSNASALTGNGPPSSIARTATDNLVRRPEDNQLESSLLSGSSKAAADDMFRPPAK